MSSKGISPLVATVLLIAATMSIAMILSFWASSFVTSGLPEQNETQTKCQFSNFEIYQCSYNASNSALDITLRNSGQNSLSDMVAFMILTNNSVYGPNVLSGDLAAGIYQSYRIFNIPAFSKLIVNSRSCTGIMPDREKLCT